MKKYILLMLVYIYGCKDDEVLIDNYSSNTSIEVFKRNCINCHLVSNEKLSEGNITYSSIVFATKDSAEKLRLSALKNEIHNIVKDKELAFDSIFSNRSHY